MSATDFLGQPLAVGNVVIFTTPRYADISIGVIYKVTPQKVRVAYKPYSGSVDSIIVDHATVVKTDNAVALKRAAPVIAKAKENGWLFDATSMMFKDMGPGPFEGYEQQGRQSGQQS